ncbi:hypothetical protein [Halococcus saccharolyticus]|uniref:Helix-turn-helix type 11 domain-containing protein n=1 Tax=Halococcus saccharolyticus DSM 5350 TaxID=1227455 RepID=M0MEX8_9EURY|nr:hypothetical protein [Halococcus saccharolyticus]EMA44276.1 hypothetical protein C449_12138 [Halococcus saccharolyticus DSM 5350]
MTDDIDYRTVEVPDVPPEEYSYVERRAEVLDLLERAGHPRAVKQADLARRYGCTRQNIHNDLDVLAEHVADNLGDRRELISEHVFHRALNGLLDDEEWRKAAQTVKDWNEWLDDRTDLQHLIDRIEALEDGDDGSLGTDRFRHR